MLWRPDFPRLNDCVVTKQAFCIVLMRFLFSIKFRCSVSTVVFSNEDNCCQLQGIGKLIKEKLLKGIFKVVLLIDVAGNTDFVKSIANICTQTTNFFYKSSAFWRYFFLKSCLKIGVAAYTQVFTVGGETRRRESKGTYECCAV